jgi:hypothetical protein
MCLWERVSEVVAVVGAAKVVVAEVLVECGNDLSFRLGVWMRNFAFLCTIKGFEKWFDVFVVVDDAFDVDILVCI